MNNSGYNKFSTYLIKRWMKMSKVTPFLMFQDGKAEEAMNYYTSFIEDSEIKSISSIWSE